MSRLGQVNENNVGEGYRKAVDRENSQFADRRHESVELCAQYYAWRVAAGEAKAFTRFGEFDPARTVIWLASY